LSAGIEPLALDSYTRHIKGQPRFFGSLIPNCAPCAACCRSMHRVNLQVLKSQDGKNKTLPKHVQIAKS